MILDGLVDLSSPSMDPNGQEIYGIMISTAQCRISDIHACEVFIALTFCEAKKKKSTIVIWVDDRVGIADTKETNDKFVEKLAAKYKIKVIGEPYMLLKMHITSQIQKPHHPTLTNPLYPPDIDEFDMEDANTVLMPMDPNMIQHKSNDGLAINQQNGISYATYIGKMLDATHAIRPDILFVTIMMA